MAVRNLEEQVLYLTRVVEEIMQSMGNALPDPIPGPKGDPGEQGEQGEQGVQGYGIIGNGTQLPSYASNGNYFILKTSKIDGIDLVLYKCISNHWVAQYSLRGNQGPVGEANEVVANPSEAASGGDLNKIEIDGVVYSIIDMINSKAVKLENVPQSTYLTEEEKDEIVNGAFINGTFLGLKNPVFFPADSFSDGDYYQGVVIGANGSFTVVSTYLIYANNNNYIEVSNNRYMRVQGLEYVNGREFPNYPVSPTEPKVLFAKPNNTLGWEELPKLYRHNITIEFSLNSKVHITVFNTNSSQYTSFNSADFSQVIGDLCVINNGGYLTFGWVKTIYEGELGIVIDDSEVEYDYLNDVQSVDDNVTRLI